MKSMLITPPCVVSLTWRLEDTQGQLIDALEEPLEFFFGGDDLLAKVEEALDGHEAGYETRIQLEPEQAFGDYQPELVCFEDRSVFPDHIEAGMQFDGLPEGAATQGMPADAIYTITEIYPGHVVLDGNHPLAGIALRLAMKVQSVREASEDEIEQRSVGSAAITLLSTAPAGVKLH